MNRKYHPSSGGFVRPFLGAIAAAALFTFGSIGTVQAAPVGGTGAGANIFNVVRVDYKDASAQNSFVKSANVLVTVAVKQATPSVMYSVSNSVSPASATSPQIGLQSGAFQDYSFWLYSNSNGTDQYNFSLSSGTTSDANAVASGAGQPTKWISSYKAPQNGAETTPPQPAAGTTSASMSNITIGATIVIGNAAGDTVKVAYGSLNGINTDDYVVMDLGGTLTMFKVRAVTNGIAPSEASYAVSAETNATIRLYNTDGTSPNFGLDAQLGKVISQVWQVAAKVTAVADDTASADADVYLKVDLATTTNAGSYDSNIDNIRTNFKRSQLVINKSASPSTAKPGDTVTYTITVYAQAANATSVKVTDAVPVYTTLVDNPFAAGGGTFARVSKAPNGAAPVYGAPVALTTVNTDTEDGALASGDAGGSVAGSALTFYLGNVNVGASGSSPHGGTISTPEIFKIEYKVLVQ